MGNYEQLKQSVSDVIKANGNQEITGSILQNVLLTIISTVGANATFAGIATPATNPGTPDGPVFYLASEGGTYTNFNAIELQDGLSVLIWNGSWSSQQIFGIDDVPIAGSDNLVKSGGVAINTNQIKLTQGFQLNAWEQGYTRNTNVEQIVASSKCISSRYNLCNSGDTIEFSVASGYVVYIYTWDGVSNTAVTKGPYSNSHYVITTPDYPILFFVVRKTDESDITPEEGNTAVTMVNPQNYGVINVVKVANGNDAPYGSYYTTNYADLNFKAQSIIAVLPTHTVNNKRTALTGKEIFNIDGVHCIWTDGQFKKLVINERIEKDNVLHTTRVVVKHTNNAGANIGDYYSANLETISYKISENYGATVLPTPVSDSNWFNLTGKELFVVDGKFYFYYSGKLTMIQTQDMVDEKIEYLNRKILNINERDNVVDLSTLLWTAGSIYTSGSNIGKSNGQNTSIRIASADCPIKLKDCNLVLNIDDGFKVSVIIWDGVSETTTAAWYSGKYSVAISGEKYIFFVLGKSDDSAINISEVDCFDASVVILPTLDNARYYSNDKKLEWWQASSSGITLSYSNIRCTSFVKVMSGELFSYNIPSGYSCAFTEKDSAGNAIVSHGWKTGSGQVFVQNDCYLFFAFAKGGTREDRVTIEEATLLSLIKVDTLYYGEQINLSLHPFRMSRYGAFNEWQNSQAGVAYGKYLIVALAMDEVESGYNGYIYNLETKQRICGLNFGNTLDGVTYKMPHGNQMCFGTQFYSANSVFPVLYVSQTTLSGNYTQFGVLVYDIQKVSDNEYTPVLVQVIVAYKPNEYTEFIEELTKWTTNYVVDTDRNKLYCFGYPRVWDWEDIDNSLTGDYIITEFDLPSLSDGNEIVLGHNDIIDQYTVYRKTGIQMIMYNNGRIYIQGGVAGVGHNKSIDVLDIEKKQIVSSIGLNYRAGEPQGLFMYDNRLLWYDAGDSGVIEEFEF